MSEAHSQTLVPGTYNFALYLILCIDHGAVKHSFFSLQVGDAKFLNQHPARGHSDLGAHVHLH